MLLRMLYLRNSILATIVYYDIFDFPLTLLEVCRYLINPGRLTKPGKPFGAAKITEVQGELDRLVRVGALGSKNGFYFIASRDYLYDRRIEREKISTGKWRKFLSGARWVVLVPYLRGFFASGSLSINNAGHNADLDVLVVASSRRLYTCRLILSLVTSIMRSRRGRYDLEAPDKFCLNHYITDSHLKINHESVYNAQAYANLKPVLATSGLVESFYYNNVWINKFVYNFKPEQDFYPRFVRTNPFLKSLAGAGELVLDSWFGSFVELVAKKYQQRRIRKNPATYESGGRVVFNDTELEFHPHSFEAIVIKRYNDGLRKLGIIPYIEETDSGLSG